MPTHAAFLLLLWMSLLGYDTRLFLPLLLQLLCLVAFPTVATAPLPRLSYILLFLSLPDQAHHQSSLSENGTHFSSLMVAAQVLAVTLRTLARPQPSCSHLALATLACWPLSQHGTAHFHLKTFALWIFFPALTCLPPDFYVTQPLLLCSLFKCYLWDSPYIAFKPLTITLPFPVFLNSFIFLISNWSLIETQVLFIYIACSPPSHTPWEYEIYEDKTFLNHFVNFVTALSSQYRKKMWHA